MSRTEDAEVTEKGSHQRPMSVSSAVEHGFGNHEWHEGERLGLMQSGIPMAWRRPEIGDATQEPTEHTETPEDRPRSGDLPQDSVPIEDLHAALVAGSLIN